jgi:hypothetical protein
VIARARQAGLAIDVESLYRHPTIAQLAVAETASPPAAPEPAPGSPVADAAGGDDAYPLSAMQLGILYACEVSGDPTLYHDLASARFAGPIDQAALRRALDRISDRHEVLRTSFDLDRRPAAVQRVHRRAEIPLDVVEGSDMRAWWAGQWQRRFDPRRPPLARCHLLLHPGGTADLALSVHHSILDGWSLAVLMAELLAAYDRELGAPSLPVPPLPRHRYRDFIELERRAVASEATVRYWRDLLEAGPAPPSLPRAGSARAAPGVDPDVRMTLPAALLAGARDLSARLAIPAKSIFLAAHVAALSALTGCDEVVTGAATNGRPDEAGADRVLGLYLNCVPVRARLTGHTWSTLAGLLFEQERAQLPHARYPLAEMTARLGRSPFEVAFNYTHFHPLAAAEHLARLRILDWWFSDRTDFPLTVEVNRRPTDFAARTVEAELCVRTRPDIPSVTAADFADPFLRALTRAVEDPDRAARP